MSLAASYPLSEGAESLLARLDAMRHAECDCDVLVVGSGYGGAVAAARLAGQRVDDGRGAHRPVELWLLERGREYALGSFPTRWSELPAHVRFSQGDGRPARGYAEALFDVRLGGDAHVLLGNGLGGGSLINAGVMLRAPDAVWAQGWPLALDRSAVQAGYASAEAMLQPQCVPQPPPKLAALQSLAAASGSAAAACPVTVNFGEMRDSAAGVTMQPCTLCGDCLTGCNQGAKGSLDTNYLALAARRGARLFCGVTVEGVLAPLRLGDPWQLHCHGTDPALRLADGRAFVVRARRVVLAAGALGSTEILLRSQAGGLDCSPRLGERFSTNGDMVAAVFRHARPVQATAEQETDASDVQARRVGPTITGKADAEQDGQAFAVEEFAVPAALGQVFGEIVCSFGLDGVLAADASDAPTEPDPSAVAGRTLTHSALYGFMGDDGAKGRLELVTAPAGQPAAVDAALRVDWPGLASLPLFDAQMAWLKTTCAAPGGPQGHVVYNPAWKPFGALLEQASDLLQVEPMAAVTVHPLGGCPMGNDAGDGVVDTTGRVFRRTGGVHQSLAVLDGAIVPRALGINPALTIAALAEQAVLQLQAAWGLQAPEACDAPPLPARVRWAARRPSARGPTAVHIRESLQGRLSLGGRPWWARLHLRFDDAPDLGALLQRRDKVLTVAEASLWLYEAADDVDEFSRPEGAPMVKAGLSGRLRLFVPVVGTQATELRYELQVDAIESGTEGPLAVGLRVVGVKTVASGSGSLWRQLSDVECLVDDVAVGTLSLDMDDLVDRQEALLAITHQSSAPDALADLAGLASYTLRRFLLGQLPGLQPHGDYADALILKNLAERLPGPLRDGRTPEVQRIGPHGARLSRYRPDGPAKGRPVLLIHGYGASGTTFTHPSIPVSLTQFLVGHGREAWVLDLRTSIGNEPDDPDQPRAGPWPFDAVAGEDIPLALETVAVAAAGRPVDVVAHCIGAAMFSVAALDRPQMRRHLGAVVLSQVGPLLRMSPANRLRGFIASYLEQFIGAEEFDVRREYRRVRRADGSVGWQRDAKQARTVKLIDVLLTTFPYDNAELSREEAVCRRTGIDFRTLRRRADAIWGHLMELDNVADATWAHLDAINGWVKVRSLAQTIHYARQGLLTDAAGRNRALRQELFQQRFDFPVLLLHGQRNRVFDWRGSRDALQLLARMRGADPGQPPQDLGDALHFGSGHSAQLLVARRYGHQDCIVGKDASVDLFPRLLAFLDAQAAKPAPSPAPTELPIEFDLPWIGPLMGLPERSADGRHAMLKLLAHPSPRRARSIGVVLVPLSADGTPQYELARGLVPAGAAPPRDFGNAAHMAIDHSAALVDKGFELRLDLREVPARVERFAVLFLHSDLPLDPDRVFGHGPQPAGAALFGHAVDIPALEGADVPDWLENGRPLHGAAESELRKQWPQLQTDGAHDAVLQVGAAVLDAARSADGARRPLCFALASCQYPPGLFDGPVAAASYARLAKDCQDARAPQFLLAVGDQIYVDATAGVFDPAPGNDPDQVLERAYALNRQLKGFRRAASRLPLASMLDDHEIRDNWQPRPPLDAASRHALTAFARHQALLNPPPLAPGGWHFAFEPAGALFVVLDTRTQRDVRRAGSQADGVDLQAARIVPDAVMRRLFERLRRADAKAAKFIVSPAPLLPAERIPPSRPLQRLRSDSWSGYPRSMLDLLSFLRDENIQRVVLLSGDAHGSAVLKLALDGGPTVFAVMSSGLFAPWPFNHARPEDFVLAGTLPMDDGTRQLQGTVQLGAWSSDNGYARIALEADGEDAHALLSVTLCSAQGGSVACRHDLREGAHDWQAVYS